MSYTENSRNEDMFRMRSSGATLQEIGSTFGISRERVRQIVGTENKNSRYEMAVQRAEKFISENPNACWNEVTAVSGLSSRALRSRGVNKRPAYGNARRWTELELVDAAFRWKDEHKKFPSSHEWTNGAQPPAFPSYNTVHRRFGSWAAYIETVKRIENNDGI